MKRRFVLLATMLALFGGMAPASAADVDHRSSEFSYTRFYPCGNDGAGELVRWTTSEQQLYLYHDTEHLTVLNVVVRQRATGVGQTTGDLYRLVFSGHPDPYKFDHDTQQGFTLSNAKLLVWSGNTLLTNQRWMGLGVTNAHGVLTASHSWLGAECTKTR